MIVRFVGDCQSDEHPVKGLKHAGNVIRFKESCGSCESRRGRKTEPRQGQRGASLAIKA